MRMDVGNQPAQKRKKKKNAPGELKKKKHHGFSYPKKGRMELEELELDPKKPL